MNRLKMSVRDQCIDGRLYAQQLDKTIERQILLP
jgi:hypothetical protein